ncbi:MAG: hypothetical protein RIM84_20390 [Alphaproteobacteria bacterium]
MHISVDNPFADTLVQAQNENKGVTLHMRSGEKFQGRIEGVSPHNVIVTELVGREFYSAVVKIDDISAIEVRVRDR